MAGGYLEEGKSGLQFVLSVDILFIKLLFTLSKFIGCTVALIDLL